MRPDVADRPQRPALVRLQPPVPVTLVEQPVLEVVTRDEANVAQPAGLDDLAEVLVQRVEPDVVVDRGHLAARRGLANELRGLRGRHRQRLLADDVAAGGQDRRCLRDVQVVGAGHMDDVHLGVGQERVEAVVCLGHPEGEARAAPRAGVLPRTPRTWTPIRRSASTWTVPMNPVPITAAPI